jgi:NADH-quinone oxidoreductase subunit K
MSALLDLLNNPLVYYQTVAVLLLGLGFFGLIWRKSLVGMLISVELMLNGAGLAIVAASQLTRADAAMGQLAALLVMGLAAAEATLVLAITVVVAKRFGHVESENISELRG